MSRHTVSIDTERSTIYCEVKSDLYAEIGIIESGIAHTGTTSTRAMKVFARSILETIKAAEAEQS